MEQQIQEIENILLADSDDSDDEITEIEEEIKRKRLDIERVKRNIKEFQTSDDEGKMEDFSIFDKAVTISDIDSKEEDKKFPSFGDVQRKKIEKMLFSDEDTDDDKSDEEALEISPPEESETFQIPSENAALVGEEIQENTDEHVDSPSDSPAETISEVEIGELEKQSNNDSASLSPLKTERELMEVEKNPLEISTVEEMEEGDPLEDPLSVDTDQTIEETAEDH